MTESTRRLIASCARWVNQINAGEQEFMNIIGLIIGIVALLVVLGVIGYRKTIDAVQKGRDEFN